MIDSMFRFLGVKRNQKDVTFPNLNSHSKHGYDDYRTYFGDRYLKYTRGVHVVYTYDFFLN